ncbi:hypothetical protein QNM18_22820 [Pseudoalteromonas sp. P94(2023)]|uniref:Uncharacterized protein n=1 Tax=Pseudoalteromonas obscura TaxID=3048491 RepID=A0ABT7ESA3_9GAMM|nr:hypothetical protein [Pseudoalteromonas sp. P94(2023)]MDK2597902.1 hypothetical protein [Pseudoalteromonas sp. P94(2023)]
MITPFHFGSARSAVHPAHTRAGQGGSHTRIQRNGLRWAPYVPGLMPVRQ